MSVKKAEEMTDYELIQACLKIDNNYFTELVARYKNYVYSIILRMIDDGEEANDLAQEVFVKVYKNLDKYYPDFKVATWLLKITTNHVIDYRRKSRCESTPIEDMEQELVAGETPEDVLLKRERVRQLNKVVGELPDMYKIPIVLYHQQGLSYQEIAEVINVPLSKVKNRIFRGRKLLKENLMALEGAQGSA